MPGRLLQPALDAAAAVTALCSLSIDDHGTPPNPQSAGAAAAPILRLSALAALPHLTTLRIGCTGRSSKVLIDGNALPPTLRQLLLPALPEPFVAVSNDGVSAVGAGNAAAAASTLQLTRLSGQFYGDAPCARDAGIPTRAPPVTHGPVQA